MKRFYRKEHALEDDKLCCIINSQMQEFLRRIGASEVDCSKCGKFDDMDICTIYTTIDGAYNIRLVFCAERALLQHIADCMMGEPVTDPEDVEECAKEFFNEVCGHIVAEIFKETHYSARFHCPFFREGYFLPGNNGEKMLVHCYTSVHKESAVFMHDPLTKIS